MNWIWFSRRPDPLVVCSWSGSALPDVSAVPARPDAATAADARPATTVLLMRMAELPLVWAVMCQI